MLAGGFFYFLLGKKSTQQAAPQAPVQPPAAASAATPGPSASPAAASSTASKEFDKGIEMFDRYLLDCRRKEAAKELQKLTPSTPYEEAQVLLEKYPAHVAVAREVNEQGIVLLKNSGVLPLSTNGTILVSGNNAERRELSGGGSGHVTGYDTVTYAEEAVKRFGKDRVIVAAAPTDEQLKSASVVPRRRRAADSPDASLHRGGPQHDRNPAEFPLCLPSIIKSVLSNSRTT